MARTFSLFFFFFLKLHLLWLKDLRVKGQKALASGIQGQSQDLKLGGYLCYWLRATVLASGLVA